MKHSALKVCLQFQLAPLALGAVAVVGVVSHRGEALHLVVPVMAGGDTPATQWIAALDSAIGASMREQTRACLRGVASRPGHEWISTGLQQAVTLVDGIVWTVGPGGYCSP
jgi:hypothetical protein